MVSAGMIKLSSVRWGGYPAFSGWALIANGKYPSEQEAEGGVTHAQWSGRCERRGRSGSNGTRSQGMRAVTRSRVKQGTDASLEFPKGAWPPQQLAFGPVTLVSNFWPPEP